MTIVVYDISAHAVFVNSCAFTLTDVDGKVILSSSTLLSY